MATPETTPPKPTPSRFSLADRLPIPQRKTVSHSPFKMPSVRTEQEEFETDNDQPNEGTELTHRKEGRKSKDENESPVKPREEVLKSLAAILQRPTKKRESDGVIPAQEQDTTERPFNLSRSFMRFPDRAIPFPPSSNRDYLYCLLLNICLCNDVIPVYEEDKSFRVQEKVPRRGKKAKSMEESKTLDAKIDESEREPIDYQGGSPDEIELVRTAKDLGLVLLGNKADDIIEVLSRQEQKILRFKMKHKFEFSSSKRRMTVIVKELTTGIQYLFTKGADTAVFSLMRIQESMLVTDCTVANLTSYSQMGYRTLCFGASMIDNESEKYSQWEDDLQLAKQLPPSIQRSERLDYLQEQVERGLHLLGASAVEDKLQKGVPQCILDFKDAGITICMLTGDKLETAENIGFSSRIFTLETHVERLKEVETEHSFSQQLNLLRKKLIERDESLFTNLAQQHQENLMRASSSSFHSQQSVNAGPSHYKSQKFASTISAAGSDKIYLQISDELMRRSLINTRRKQNPTNAPRERRLTAIREGLEEESMVRPPRCPCRKGKEKSRLRGMHLSQGVVPLGGNQSPKEKSPEERSHIRIQDRQIPQLSTMHARGDLQESKSAENLMNNDDPERPIPDVGLIIDSKALDMALMPEYRHKFFEVFSLCTAVICCRATPKQKAEVVNLIRSKKSFRNKLNQWVEISALAIGDGGNDVNMIQQADVGVGIFGKEGNQAANAADYAFAQFRFLRKLVLVHGRFIALRFSYFIYFFFFKNCLLTFVQFFFAFETMFTGTTFWESFYLTNYNTLTGFPIGARTLVEEDIDLRRARNAVFVPFLYRRARDQNLYFTYKKFGLWNVYGLFASFLVYIGVSRIYTSKSADVNAGYDSSMWGRSLTAFNILLVLLLVLILSDSHHYNWLYWLCILATHLLVFPGFAIIYNFIPNTEVSFNLLQFLWTWKFAFALLIIVSMTYLPYFFMDEIRRLFTPRHIDLLYDYYSGLTAKHAKEITERRNHILSANVMAVQPPAPPEIQSHKVSDNSLNLSANSKQSSLPEEPDTIDFQEGSRHHPEELDSVRKGNLFQ